MQDRELNRATTGVVSSMDVRGRATADEIKRGLQNDKKRCFWRIASSAILGYLMAVGLLVALLAPLPASADDGKGIPAEIAALQAQLASLQSTVSALQEQLNSLQSSNTTLQKQLATVQSNHALLLGPFVNVDPNPEIGVVGPNIIFSGANIHIVSGSGATNDNGNPTGLGNLIIGYDEDPGGLPEVPGFGIPPTAPALEPHDRGGSHNLVIGSGNRFTTSAFGGLVAGYLNTISNFVASVSGGSSNEASGPFANVSGGQFNQAGGALCSVSGGFGNTAGIFAASVSGGLDNIANNFFASVLGGQFNTASQQASVVLGGENNTAGGFGSVVIGGQNITVSYNKEFSIAPNPPFP